MIEILSKRGDFYLVSFIISSRMLSGVSKAVDNEYRSKCASDQQFLDV